MRRPEPHAADVRLHATLVELDAPARIAPLVRALVHAGALRLAAWTAPAEDVYVPRLVGRTAR